MEEQFESKLLDYGIDTILVEESSDSFFDCLKYWLSHYGIARKTTGSLRDEFADHIEKQWDSIEEDEWKYIREHSKKLWNEDTRIYKKEEYVAALRKDMIPGMLEYRVAEELYSLSLCIITPCSEPHPILYYLSERNYVPTAFAWDGNNYHVAVPSGIIQKKRIKRKRESTIGGEEAERNAKKNSGRLIEHTLAIINLLWVTNRVTSLEQACNTFTNSFQTQVDQQLFQVCNIDLEKENDRFLKESVLKTAKKNYASFALATLQQIDPSHLQKIAHSLKYNYFLLLYRKAKDNISNINVKHINGSISQYQYAKTLNESILMQIAARSGAYESYVSNDTKLTKWRNKGIFGVVMPDVTEAFKSTFHYKVTQQYINAFKLNEYTVSNTDAVFGLLVASILYLQHNGNRFGMFGVYHDRESQCAFDKIQNHKNASYCNDQHNDNDRPNGAATENDDDNDESANRNEDSPVDDDENNDDNNCCDEEDDDLAINIYQPDRGQYLGHNIAAIAVVEDKRDNNEKKWKIVAHAFNHITLYDDHMEHAEMRLLKTLKHQNIPPKDVRIYSSLEPCHQCFGTLLMNEISYVRFLQMDFRIGMAGYDLLQREEAHHKMDYGHVPICGLDADYVFYLAKSTYLSHEPIADKQLMFYTGPALQNGRSLEDAYGIPYFLCTDDAFKSFEECYQRLYTILDEENVEDIDAVEKSKKYLEEVVGKINWQNCGTGGRDDKRLGRCTFRR